MSEKQEKLELDLLRVKIELIQSITNCSNFEQLDQYVHSVKQVFNTTSFLKKNRVNNKEVKNVKILKDH